MARGSSETDSVQGRAIRLGADVRRRRLAAGLTQQLLADRIGYDRSYLSQVETGAQIPAEQFILQCERQLAAGGDLLLMFRELLAEREARRQQGHTKRWHTTVGDQLRVERVSPPARELKTLQFVAWAAEHSGLGFQEVYDAVVAHTTLLEALAPSVRHAEVHRRSRVTREDIAQALVAYYHSSSTDRRYSSRDAAGLQALITDPRWSNEGLFAFLEGLRRLATLGSVSRLALPTIETRRDGG